MNEIRASDVREWRDYRVGQVKRGTVAREFASVRYVFKELCRLGKLPTDPTANVRSPKGISSRRTCPSPAEVQAFLSAIKGTKWEIAAYLAARAGLRRGEIFRLRLEHIRDDLIIVVSEEGN